MIIAIDGPAASGKGTLARHLAAIYGLAHLDTGLLYRAVGMKAHELGIFDERDLALVASQLTLEDLHNPSLRGDEAGIRASKVAVFPEVRSALVAFQRSFAKDPPDPFSGAVLDGRDIGTVILPEASIKFYVTTDIEVRAKRRFQELKERAMPASYEDVLCDMHDRDARDQGRAHAPLKIAEDAFVIDATALTPEDVFAKAKDYITKVQGTILAQSKMSLQQP